MIYKKFNKNETGVLTGPTYEVMENKLMDILIVEEILIHDNNQCEDSQENLNSDEHIL